MTHPQVLALLKGHAAVDEARENRLFAVARLAVNGSPEEVQAWLDRSKPKPADPDKQTGSATFI